jgi:DUF1009 family protein
MHRAGGGCIAIGVGRVIIVDLPAVIDAADRAGIAIVGVRDEWDTTSVGAQLQNR